MPIKRKGARRISEVDGELLSRLNAGLDETVNLMEWLAVDMQVLSNAVFSDPAFGLSGNRILERIPNLSAVGVTKRLAEIGDAVVSTIPDPDSPLLRILAKHRSDVVRQWAVYSVNAFSGMSFVKRLRRVREFAKDQNMSVRECAWMAFRPHLAANLNRGIQALLPWVIDQDPNVRRFAIEVTRPRSVWGRHIPELKREPKRAISLLEPVKADPSAYVRTAVANWLNDASKSQPSWVVSVCENWSATAGVETRWIIHRALRSYRRTCDKVARR